MDGIDQATTDYIIGWAGCIISALAFGTMLLPVKPYDMKDGLYIQWVQSSAILVCGFIVHCVLGFPKMYPEAVFGGVIWATGNVLTVPIVNAVGMGLAMLIMGSFQIVSGWGSGRFGLFGLKAEVPKSDLLEYLGVAITLVSALFFAGIQPAAREEQAHMTREQDETLDKIKPKETPSQVRFRVAWGVALCIVCGLILGQGMTPLTYVQESVPGSPQNGLYYSFGYGIGAFTAASFYFFVYAAAMRNQPYVLPEVTFPAMLYGVGWSIGMFTWFMSSSKLSQSVSFPINSRLPGIVSMLWGLIWFREIRGARNLLDDMMKRWRTLHSSNPIRW